MKRTIVLGDLHIVRETPARVLDDLIGVVEAHRGARIVFAGDLFDLSADHPGVEKNRALELAVAAQPRVSAALREHVERGGDLWLVGGNHDPAVGSHEAQATFASLLGIEQSAAHRVRSSPWFFREGGLHLEHGHLYDPDNATAHPLVSGVRSLGVHFVEEFIAPTGAFRYLNANDGTPLKLLASAFAWYGVRGPYVVFKYFDAAFRAVAKSGLFYRGAREHELGARREADFAAESETPMDVIGKLLELKAQPTMQSTSATLQRLYLDRVTSTVALATGVGLLAAGKRKAALRTLSFGALTMSISWALGHDRYGGTVPERLSRSADQIAERSGARLVVMGHAHREAVRDRYANTGSFSFPMRDHGRPFLEIEGTAEAPRAVLRHVARS